VHEARAGAVEQRSQRGHVDRQWIDDNDVVATGELQQGQLGVVRALAVELGVESVGVGSDRRLDEGVEVALVVDPAKTGRIGWSRYGSIPVVVGSPASIQAVVPPATLTASMPCAR
jgi:hypothetical protein